MSKIWYKIQVCAYSGYKGTEGPSSFIWNDKEYEIFRIIETRQEEDLRTRQRKTFFKVKTKDGDEFLLCYDQDEDVWYIEKR